MANVWKPKYENDAGRLLCLVNAAKKKAEQVDKKKRHTETVWGTIGGGGDTDILLAKAQLILDRLRKRLEYQGGGPFLVAVPPIKSVLRRDVTATKVLEELTPQTLAVLELYAESLPVCGEIPDADLDAVSTSINKLFKQIRDAQIDDDLRELLLRLLSRMRQAIDDFWISGVDGLDEHFSFVVGELGRNKQIIEPNKDTAPFQGFWGVVQKLQGLIQKGRKLIGLSRDATKLIDDATEVANEVGEQVAPLIEQVKDTI